jgi:flagellar biosynthesis GTPase FlhF
VKGEGEDWATQFEVVAIDPGDAGPLQIEVREPKNLATLLPDAAPVLSGKVSAGKGVRSVAVTVNGETVSQETAKGKPRRTVILDTSLPLRDGKNIILVTATDPAGTTSQEALTVVYVAPLHLKMPPPDKPLRVGREHVVLAVPMPPAAVGKTVHVSLNGAIVESFHADPANTHSAKLKLEPGPNSVRIVSDQVEERTIVFDPAAGDAPPTQLAVASPSGEVDRLAEDQRLQDEQRLAEERKRQEDQRLAEEKRQQEKQQQEKHRLADEKRRGDEAQRLAEEQRRREDAQRLSDEKRQQDEQRRLAEERRRQEDQQRVAALPPLVFTLSSPRDQARFDHESIGLAGLVSGDRGVSRVAIALNGVEVSRQEERTPQRAVALNLPIRLREGQNTLVVTVTGADGTISQEVRTVFYERATPLTVTMRFPQDQMRVTDAASIAAAVVTSSKGVARVSVTVNGVEAHQQTDKTPQKSVLITVPVKLQAGVNVVAVSATDAEGSVRQEVRSVHFDPPAPIAVLPPVPPPPQHDRWAVVIGVGQYEHPAIPRLRYTVSDAEAMYQTLTGPAGFKRSMSYCSPTGPRGSRRSRTSSGRWVRSWPARQRRTTRF